MSFNNNEKQSLENDLARLGHENDTEGIRRFVEDVELLGGYEDLIAMAQEKINEIEAASVSAQRIEPAVVEEITNAGGSVEVVDQMTAEVDAEIEDTEGRATETIQHQIDVAKKEQIQFATLETYDEEKEKSKKRFSEISDSETRLYKAFIADDTLYAKLQEFDASLGATAAGFQIQNVLKNFLRSASKETIVSMPPEVQKEIELYQLAKADYEDSVNKIKPIEKLAEARNSLEAINAVLSKIDEMKIGDSIYGKKRFELNELGQIREATETKSMLFDQVRSHDYSLNPFQLESTMTDPSNEQYLNKILTAQEVVTMVKAYWTKKQELAAEIYKKEIDTFSQQGI
ncbi:MAG: hypothetical protein MUD00_02925 [Candidatus Pacebacteria bacterium]|jgi:hypothetical protein|nr:hypothetical protein [Candidatus Paceibacterota bacterium]